MNLKYLIYGPDPKPIWLRPAYVIVVGSILVARMSYGFGLVEVISLAILGTIAVHGLCALLAKD